MESSLCLKTQPFISTRNPLFFNVTGVFSTTSLRSKINVSRTFLISSNPPILEESKRPQVVILAARKNPRRTTLRIPAKAALQCAFFIASTLKILPEPVNLIIKEGFEGGNGGGGLGFWNGFGGGGGFDGWKRKKWKFGFLGWLVLVVAGVMFAVLMLGKDFEGFGELGLGVLGVLLLVVLERDWKRGVKGWTLGFCSCALMVLLGFKREELQKWLTRSGVQSHVMDLFRSKRRRRRLLNGSLTK